MALITSGLWFNADTRVDGHSGPRYIDPIAAAALCPRGPEANTHMRGGTGGALHLWRDGRCRPFGGGLWLVPLPETLGMPPPVPTWPCPQAPLIVLFIFLSFLLFIFLSFLLFILLLFFLLFLLFMLLSFLLFMLFSLFFFAGITDVRAYIKQLKESDKPLAVSWAIVHVAIADCQQWQWPESFRAGQALLQV